MEIADHFPKLLPSNVFEFTSSLNYCAVTNTFSCCFYTLWEMLFENDTALKMARQHPLGIWSSQAVSYSDICHFIRRCHKDHTAHASS